MPKRPTITSTALAVTTLIVTSLGVSACCAMQDNARATAACRSQASQKGCAICCPNNGATASVYISGACTCKGTK